jgi:hypothetical protein
LAAVSLHIYDPLLPGIIATRIRHHDVFPLLNAHHIIIYKWLRVLQIPLTSCRIWRNLILQHAAISFT